MNSIVPSHRVKEKAFLQTPFLLVFYFGFFYIVFFRVSFLSLQHYMDFFRMCFLPPGPPTLAGP